MNCSGNRSYRSSVPAGVHILEITAVYTVRFELTLILSWANQISPFHHLVAFVVPFVSYAAGRSNHLFFFSRKSGELYSQKPYRITASNTSQGGNMRTIHLAFDTYTPTLRFSHFRRKRWRAGTQDDTMGFTPEHIYDTLWYPMIPGKHERWQNTGLRTRHIAHVARQSTNSISYSRIRYQVHNIPKYHWPMYQVKHDRRQERTLLVCALLGSMRHITYGRNAYFSAYYVST